MKVNINGRRLVHKLTERNTKLEAVEMDIQKKNKTRQFIFNLYPNV